jgi:hypothetical protein
MVPPREELLEGYTCEVKTPDGTMFVVMNEDTNGELVEIHIHIGKAGTPLMAWAEALAHVASLALRYRGVSVGDLLCELGNISSDRSVRIANGATIRSGPEGLAYALQCYQRSKHQRRITNLKIDRFEPPRLNTGD